MNPLFMAMKMEILLFMAFLEPMNLPWNLKQYNSWTMKNTFMAMKNFEI